jgi:hypothetical protein
MITTYTFGKKNNGINNKFFHTSSKPDYSKILDDIILADVIDKNSYLFETKTNEDYLSDIILNANRKKNTKLENAINFLANYKKPKKSYILPFKLNTTYTLADGTPIIFYDDEIQIGFDYYKYSDFSDLSFINALTPSKKKIIIDIYTLGNTNIDININL